MIRFALLLGAALAAAPVFATPTNYLGELQPGVVASGQFVQLGLPSDPNQDEVFASFSGMAGQHIRVSAQANDHGFSAYVLVAPGLQLDDNSFYGAFPLFPTGGTVPVCGGVTCNWNPLAYYSRDTEAFTLPSTGEYTVLLLGTCFSRRVPSCFNAILAGSPPPPARDYFYSVVLNGILPTQTRFVPDPGSPLAPVPEPAAFILFGFGVLAAIVTRRLPA